MIGYWTVAAIHADRLVTGHALNQAQHHAVLFASEQWLEADADTLCYDAQGWPEHPEAGRGAIEVTVSFCKASS